LLAQVEEFRQAELAPRHSVEAGVNQRHSLRLLVGQRLEQHAIHHAENGAGGANAQGEGEYGQAGEGGILS
jgi:hypothetical protein